MIKSKHLECHEEGYHYFILQFCKIESFLTLQGILEYEDLIYLSFIYQMCNSCISKIRNILSGAANIWNKLQMRLQTNLSAIQHYSNLTGNREKCQAAERKQTTKNHTTFQIFCFYFFSYWFPKQIYSVLSLVPHVGGPFIIHKYLKERLHM